MTAYMAPGLKTVEEIVASQWLTTVDEMHTKKRYMDVAEARQVVMWYAHERRGYSFFMAGKIFGKNHATAIHARNTVNNLIETDRNFRGRLETVLRHIEKINAKLGFELK